jgi:hypothetical protein
MRVIKEFGAYRIIERADIDADFDDLCGDVYNLK